MDNHEFLQENLMWALTLEASLAIQDMTSMGIDPDLALLMIEKHWPEGRVYKNMDEFYGSKC